MLFGNTISITKACELIIVKELKLKEENNLFVKFSIMQNGGKRKETITSYNTLIGKLYEKEKEKEKKKKKTN